MKKLRKIFLLLLLSQSLFLIGCKPESKPEDDVTPPESTTSEEITLNLWSYTDEQVSIIQKYLSLHPDVKVKLNVLNTSNDNNYQTRLDNALKAGGENAPDIYAVENSFLLKYSKGSMSKYAMPYKNLGIDIDAKIAAADIAQYTIDLGSNSNGDVVGLCYQTSGGCFIYRRSIADTVFGQSDPAKVNDEIGGGSGEWDDFISAAATCNANDCSIISGIDDIWRPVENSAECGWIKEGKLYIDPKREAFLDLANSIIDCEWSNEHA